MGDTDGVEVEEVVPGAAEQVDELVGGGQPVAHRAGYRVRLGPDDLVADDPAVSDERQGEPFRAEQQALLRRALPKVGAVGVAEVEPQGARGDEDTGNLGA